MDYTVCHLNCLILAWYICPFDLLIRWYIDLAYYKLIKCYSNCIRFVSTCSLDDGFPAVTFYFENSLSLKVYPHDYLFPSVSIRNWKLPSFKHAYFLCTKLALLIGRPSWRGLIFKIGFFLKVYLYRNKNIEICHWI